MKKNNNLEKFTGEIDVYRKDGAAKIFLGGLVKFLKTMLAVLICAGVIVGTAAVVYLVKLANEPLDIDLDAKSMNLTSFIYVQNTESGQFEPYQEIYDDENRVWIDFEKIPDAMKKAIVAIEDKRFNKHHGVDWLRTGGAVVGLLTGSDSYGGSTLTQQLIKNVTLDNDVSIARKLREIFRALKLEKKYSKDQILEAYLNIVNFGGNCQGIEAASQLYFGKSATDCSIAECAAIVGITQNPSKWNPLIYPSNNKIRREIIINELFDQGLITEEEFNTAMEESANMKFVGYSSQTVDDINYDDDDDDEYIQNWYIDAVFRQATKDIAAKYHISEDAAETKLYTEGLKIYSAMDLRAQEIMEEEALNIDKSENPDLEIGMTMVGFDGRVIATVGSSFPKSGALVFDRANMSVLQPGSSIKPIVVYPYALDKGIINYSSLLKDEPLKGWGDEPGPQNWYRYYKGSLTLFDAIEWSSNATAVQVMSMIGPKNAYDEAVNKLGFKNLTDIDAETLGGLSIGGLNGGVTVTEMANAITYIGNGGKVFDAYTYYYITDQSGNVIIDNRYQTGKQAYSEETASIMNRLLYNNVNSGWHTAAPNARVSGWEISGKTGTTDDYYDSWFVGASPYASLAVWTGFDKPDTIDGNGTDVSSVTFSKVMTRYLEDKEHKSFRLSDNVTSARYCTATGKLANDSMCASTAVGYYTWDNMPGTCSASDHAFVESETKPTEQPSTAPSTEPPTPPPTEPSSDPSTDPSTDPPTPPPTEPSTDPSEDSTEDTSPGET